MPKALLLSGLLLICASPLRAVDDNLTHRDQLRERYQQILMRRPQRAAAFEWLYQSYSDDEGVDVWVDHLQASPDDNFAAPLILGYIAERNGHDEDALSQYNKASTLNPKEPTPHAARGMLLHRLGRPDEATEALRTAIACKPPHDEAIALYRVLGDTHLSAGRNEEALATWLKLAEQYRNDPAVIEEVADVLLQQHQFEAAFNQYTKLVAMEGDPYRTVRAQIAIASIDLEHQRTDEAIERLTSTLESLAPDSWLRAEVRQRIEMAFLNVGRTDELVGFYKDWETRRPGDLDMAKALSQLHLRLNDTDEANRVMRHVVQRAPSDADAHRRLADLLAQQGRADEAAVAQKRACELEPTNAEGWRRLGQIYLLDHTLKAHDRRDRAAAAWQRIVEGRPDDPTRALMAADLLRTAGMTDLAIDQYQKLINLDPHNTAGYEHLGQYLQQLGRDDDAVAVLQSMVTGDNDVPGNHVRLAQLLDELNYDTAALEAIHTALDRVGKGAEAFDLTMRQHRIYIKRKAYDKAEQSLADADRLAQTAAEHRDALAARVDLYQKQHTPSQHVEIVADPLSRAMLLLAANKPEAAADIIVTAIHADTDSTWRIALAAEVLADANQPAKAIELLNTLTRREPRHEAVYMRQIAGLARAMHDWTTAAAAAQRMITLSPDRREGYLLAADVFDEQEEADKAIGVLREGVRRNPRDATLLAALAHRLSNAGESSAAIDRYWRAYDAATDEVQKRRHAADLARIHIQHNRFGSLVAQWNRRRRDATQQLAATLALADAYRQAKMLDEAEQTLREASRLRPGDIDITGQLVELTANRGAIDDAITYAQRLVAMPGSGAADKSKLASLLNDAGRTDEAVHLWQSLAGDVDRMNAEAAIELADTFARHGLEDESLRVLRDAIRRWPNDWKLLFRAAVVFAQDGDHDRANTMFDTLLAMKRPGNAAPSAAADFWMHLPRLQSQITAHLPTSTSPFGNQSARFTAQADGIVPNDFRSTRAAALMYRLDAAQRSGTLKAYMHNLAARAGYTLTAEALAMNNPQQPNNRDATARQVLLQALVLLNLNDEAFAALQQFIVEQPNDLELAALNAVFPVSPPPPLTPAAAGTTRVSPTLTCNFSTHRADRLTRMMQQDPSARDTTIRMARRIVKEAARQPNRAASDHDVRTAVNVLIQTKALDDVLAELETQLKEMPDNVAIFQRLWVYYTLSNKRDAAHQLFERRLAARPDDVYSRYEYAVSLSRNSQFPQAADQFERVIQDAPQLVQDGYSLLRVFDKAKRIGRLVELIEAAAFNQQLSVVRHADGSRWLTKVASSLEQKEPGLALRLYLKHTSVSRRPRDISSSHIAALRLAATTNNIRVLMTNLHTLGPTDVPHLQHGSDYHDMARALWTVRNNKPMMLTDPPRHATAAQAIVNTLAKHEKLDALDRVIETNTSNNDWYTNIGLPLAALRGIANQPQNLSAARLLATTIEANSAAPNQQTQFSVHEPLCLMMIDELGRNKFTLPLAARFALAGLNQPQSSQGQLHAELTFHMTLARAAIAEGNREKAAEHYRNLAAAEPADRAQLVASGVSHIASYDMNTFTQKQDFAAAMAEDGFIDIAVDMLLGYESSFTAADSTHYTLQYERLLAATLTDEPMRSALPAQLDAMRSALDEHPDNAALAASLLRLYRLVGRDEEAIAIAEQTKTPSLIKPADRMAIAQRMAESGKDESARQLVVSLVADGEGHRITNDALISTLFTTPAQWENLTSAIEALKPEASIVELGEWWIINLTSALHRNAQSDNTEHKAAYDRLHLRLWSEADRLSAARNGNAGGDRRHLGTVVDLVAQVEGNEAAYAYLCHALVPEKDAQGIASFARAFTAGGQHHGEVQCLATRLIKLADQTGQLDTLSKTIDQACRHNTLWRDVGIRMKALIAIHQNDMAAAKKWIEQAAAEPVVDVNFGYDESYLIIAPRAAKHVELRSAAMDLYKISWTSMLMSPRQSGHALQLLAPLATAHVADKQHDALQGLFAQFVRRMGAEHGPEYAQKQIMGLCRFAGSLYAEAGDHARALDYYRVLLRHPYAGYAHIPGDKTRHRSDEVIVRLLEALHNENLLDKYMAQLPQDPIAPDDPPHNVEPMVLRVTALLVAGKFDEAAKASSNIRTIDFPAGAQVWSRVVGKHDNKTAIAQVRKLSEPILIQWPSVFSANIDSLLNIYMYEHRNPPVEGLEATIRSVASHKDAPEVAPVVHASFDGSPHYSGVMPPHAWLYRSTQSALRRYLLHPLIAQRDEAKLPLIGWMYQYMDADGNVIEWLDAMRTKQPKKAYDVVTTMLSGEQGATWTMAKLFASSSTYNAGIVRLPRHNAQVIIETARDAGQLDAFAALCRNGSLSIKPQAASRLALLADAAAGGDGFADTWAMCVKGDARFHLPDEKYYPFQLYEPALIALIHLTPPEAAATLIADEIPARSRRAFAHPDHAHGNDPLPIKRIELLILANQRDAAVTAMNDLVQQHASTINTRQISNEAQYIEQIARKYELQDAAYTALSTASSNNERLKKAYRHPLARLQREVDRAQKETGEPSP